MPNNYGLDAIIHTSLNKVIVFKLIHEALLQPRFKHVDATYYAYKCHNHVEHEE